MEGCEARMIRSSTVLECLDISSSENHEFRSSKRYYDGLYCKDGVDESLHPLFNPPCTESDDKKSDKRKKESSINDTHEQSLNLEFLVRVCKGVKFLITPAEGKVNYFKESVMVFRDCLESLSIVNLESISCDNGKTYFDNLIEGFFSFLDSEHPHEIKLTGENDEKPNTSASTYEPTELSREDELELVKQLFLSMVLCYNWSLQLLSYANSAIEIAASGVYSIENQKVLSVALGVKEANRHIVFYTSVFYQLWEMFKEQNSLVSSVISDFMSRLAFIKQIIHSEMSYEPHAWNRIKSHLHPPNVDPSLSILNENTEHGEILGVIRNEMMVRINGKVSCDYLRKECDLVSQDLTQMEEKNQQMLEKIDSLKKQLQEISNLFKTEQNIGKIMDSKKFPDPLARLASHLRIFATSNPMREIMFKVIKDNDYSFQMAISAPKDMLFPSLESTKCIFPITFHIHFNDRIYVTQTSRPSIHQSVFLPVKVLERFKGVENKDEKIDEVETWGLHEFENQLPNTFHQRMQYYYERASEFVWNLYILESYKSNGKETLKRLLPQELLEYDCKSTYTYKEGSLWILQNPAASVEVEVVTSNDNFDFVFQNYSSNGTLGVLENTPLVAYLKAQILELPQDPVNVRLRLPSINLQVLNGFSSKITDYFGAKYALISLSVLFESFGVCGSFN